MHNTLVQMIRAHCVNVPQISAQTHLPSICCLKLEVFAKQLAKWTARTVMVIVWWEIASLVLPHPSSLSLYFSLFGYLSLPRCVSSMPEGPGRSSRSSISSQAEPSSCQRLDSCHANTPTAIIGALMGLSLTWEEEWAKEGGEAWRGKRMLWEICRGEGRWRRSLGCRKKSRIKTERWRRRNVGLKRDGSECKKGGEAVEWH